MSQDPPRTTPGGTGRALDPSRAVRRRTAIAAVVAILRPLPGHCPPCSERPNTVSGKRADGRGLPGVPLAATGVAVGIVRADGIAQGWAVCVTSYSVFGPPEQPIGLAGLFGRPSDVSFWHHPGNIDHRSAATTPAFIGGLVAVAAAIGRARIPFVEGHFKPADCKLSSNRR